MLDEKTKQMLDLYNNGLELYKQKQFPKAREFFQKALQVKPEDGPSQLYVERCDLLIQNPPGADWDGTFTMTSK